MRTISTPAGTFFSRCCASVTPPNPPPTIITLRSLTFRLHLSESVVFAQSFFKFGLCRPITLQRLLKLVIGSGESCLRFENIGHERFRKSVLVRVDAQIFARRFLCQLSDDESLACLLELAELVAYINEDATFFLAQEHFRLLNGLLLFRELISL